MKFISKGNSVRLTIGLTSCEFACRCSYSSCRTTLVSEHLILAYKKFRALVQSRLLINSGFRCTAHNFDVHGRPSSRHLSGEAIDLSLKPLNHIPISRLQLMAEEAGFTYIKFYKTFVHLDVR